MPATIPTAHPRTAFLRRVHGWIARGRPRSRLATEMEGRLLALLVDQNLSSMRAAASVILMTLLIAPLLTHTVATVWLLLARAVAMGFFQYFALALGAELAAGRASDRAIRRVVVINAVAAFLWGALTWPLVISTQLDFMSFLIITIALFSICLSVVSAGLHRPTLIATAIGGGLGLAPKIAVLTFEIGYLLPLGFAIYLATIVAYALVIARQAQAGVLNQIRAERFSQRFSRTNADLERALARANWLASRDALTELRNRRAFEEDVTQFARQFGHRTMGLLLLDIDHFKRINDRFGHETGDGVLVAVGTALRQWEEDGQGRICGRWGGEEFIALVALRRGEHLESAAEDIRQRIEDLGEMLHWPSSVTLTTSIGCAVLKGPDDFDRALFHADGALYAAKDSGRNCWRLAA